ncbi:MAG: hypothetical protein Kow0042_07730 [Calditrichia bacterium]
MFLLFSPAFGQHNKDAHLKVRRRYGEADLPVFTPGNRLLSAEEKVSIIAIIEDFQVNENAGPGGAEQMLPSIAVNGAGNFVMVWIDRRNDADGDIYSQRYTPDGTVLGANFIVTAITQKIQFYPDVQL